MNGEFVFTGNDKAVTADEFIQLFKSRHPLEEDTLEPVKVAELLRNSIVVSARLNGELQGLVRILTDGYLFGAITEVLAQPSTFNDAEFWTKMLTVAASVCPTRLVLATHRADPELLRDIGWEYALPSYVYRGKPRVANDHK